MSPRQRSRVTRKSPQDLECMRASGRLCAQALARVGAAAAPGVATADLDNLVREFLHEQGAEPSFLGYRGYPAALCVEIEDVVVHGIPSGETLREGQILGVDLGVYYRGFHTDAAVTVPVGEVDETRRRLLQVTRECLAAAIRQMQVGKRLGEVSAAIQAVAEAAGFGVVQDLVGHGIGRSMHEAPQVPNFVAPGQFAEYDMILRPGMTLAVEPMITAGTANVRLDNDGWTVRTADGQPSAHFEHTVAVTRPGPEILTRT